MNNLYSYSEADKLRRRFAKRQIFKEAPMAEDEKNPLNVYKFVCRKCMWTSVFTLIGAPRKCPSCGSDEYLDYALYMTKSRKIRNLIFKKFNPKRDKPNYDNKSSDPVLKRNVKIETKNKVKMCCLKCGVVFETEHPEWWQTEYHKRRECPISSCKSKQVVKI